MKSSEASIILHNGFSLVIYHGISFKSTGFSLKRGKNSAAPRYSYTPPPLYCNSPLYAQVLEYIFIVYVSTMHISI